MKKLFLNPLFAPITFCLGMLFLGVFAYTQYVGADPLFFEPGHFCDMLTYTLYGLGLIAALYCVRDFKDNKTSYVFFIFLWLCALLREMGIQHWMTTTDTTAFKIRFFTNPNNPLFEKMIAGSLLLGVGFIGIYLIFKYMPKIWHGFWNKQALYWTIATFGCVGIICKFADRFPGNYHKATGEFLSFETSFWFSLTEEGGEAMLPVLFAIAMLQYHFLKKGK